MWSEKSSQKWLSNNFHRKILKYKTLTRTCTNGVFAYYNIGHFNPNRSNRGVVSVVEISVRLSFSLEKNVKFITKSHKMNVREKFKNKEKKNKRNVCNCGLHFLKASLKIQLKEIAVLASLVYINSNETSFWYPINCFFVLNILFYRMTVYIWSFLNWQQTERHESMHTITKHNE